MFPTAETMTESCPYWNATFASWTCSEFKNSHDPVGSGDGSGETKK